MTAREDLIVAISDALLASAPSDKYGLNAVTEADLEAVPVADAILAAGYRKPRTVTTTEELDALPVGTTVFWAEEAWFRVKAGSSGWQDFGGQTWTLIINDTDPATVLHAPEVAA